MVSQIDPTVPVFGNPTTASVRANFLIAKNEITALQNQVGIGAPVSVSAGGTGASTPAQAAINLQVLPLTGGTLTGPLTLFGPPSNNNDAATKAYVDAYFPVSITNGGTGSNNATQARLNLGAAPLNSPNFVGNPTAPTPGSSDNSNSLATTAFVQSAFLAKVPISVAQGGTGATTSNQALLNLGAAPLNSPFFTGVPLAPNPNLGSSNQQVATTQFVMASLDAFPGGASVTLSPTAPANPRDGDLWYNTTNNELNMWNGTNWVPVGGATGPVGPAGPPGQGLAINGTVPTASALPTTGVAVNSVYMALDTGVAYIWDGTTWHSLGAAIQGPPGPQGPPGTGGGAATVIGDTPPTTPAVGQLWWDSVGGQLYIYFQDADSTQWVIANNQPGPAGPAGATGATGPQGPPGTPWPEAPTDGRTYGRDGATTSWNPVPTEAPNDGQGYLRVGVLPGTWTPGLPIAGGTLTGALTLDGNATLALQAVPLQQLTAAITAGTANYLPLAGGALTGGLSIGGNLSISGSSGLQAVTASSINCTGTVIGSEFSGASNTSANLNCGGGNSLTFAQSAQVVGGVLVASLNGSAGHFIPFASNATNFGALSGTAGPTGTGLQYQDMGGNAYQIFNDVVSDERIKANIATTTVDALAVLNQIPVRQYDIPANIAGWYAAIGKSGTDRDNALTNTPASHVAIGLVTQDISPQIPEAVSASSMPQPEGSPLPVDMQSWNAQSFIPYLLLAIQQLAARVAALDGKPV